MRRKFKYFGLIPLMLSTFLATSVVVSCSGEQEGVLSSIAVTSMPNTVEYAVGSSLRTSGLEVTAYYYGGDSKVLNSSEYDLTRPDMSTAGEKEVLISYTEDEVTCTTSFTITVYENPIVDFTISDEFTVSVGTNFDNLYVPVYGVYEDGTTSLVSSDQYNVYTFMSGTMSTPTLGSVIAEYKDNVSIYDEVRTLQYEAEDAVATGTISQGTQVISGNTGVDCAYTTSGGGANLGTLTFNFTVVDSGNYDISISAANNFVYNTSSETSEHYLADGTGVLYDQNDLAINTVATLTVNGTSYEIEDTAVHNLGLRVNGLIYYLGSDGFQLIRLANVPLNVGTNSITLGLISSTIEQTNRWGYTPSINIDYLRIDEAAPKSIVGVEVATLPDTTTYLVGSEFDSTGIEVHAVYDDGSTGVILDHTYTIGSVDTSTAGTKSATVTYGEFTTTFDVTVVNEPDSIRIDTDSYALNYYDDLENLSVPVIASLNGVDSVLPESTYTVVAKQNGQAVNGNAGFDTYTIEITYNDNTSITCSEEFRVTKYTYDMYSFTGTNVPSITYNYDWYYMEFNMTKNGTIVIDFPAMSLPAGTFELSMDMLNLYVSGSGTYTTGNFDLSQIMTVTLNNQALTLEDSTVQGGNSYSGVSGVMSSNNLFNKSLLNITFEQETSISLSITFTEDVNQQNTWDECSIVINNFYITPVS